MKFQFFRADQFDAGTAQGIGVFFCTDDYAEGPRHAVKVDTHCKPETVAKALRQLADWIEENVK